MQIHGAYSSNYTVTVLDRLQAKGQHDAVVAGDRRISGTDATNMVLRFSAALRRVGLKQGDGVALLSGNSPEALLLCLAVHFSGCRLVFVPPEPGAGELAAYIRQADVATLVFDPVFEPLVDRVTRLVSIPLYLSIGPSQLASDFLAEVPDTTEASARDAADTRHVTTLLYTGGTTGAPKPVTHNRNYYAAFVRASTGFSSRSPEPRTLICTLTTHSSGHNGAVNGFLTGQTIVLMKSFQPASALSLMKSESVTSVVLVTPMLYELLDTPEWANTRFPALEKLYYTGAPAAASRLRQAAVRFGPVLHQVYGASESGVVTVLGPEEHDVTRPELFMSCGRPAAGVEVQLRDEAGAPVPVGDVGELWVRSPMVMTGYWKDPERSAEVLGRGGWFRSGDVARQDKNGYLYLIDRVRDIIVTGVTADNVYSRLLDDFLLSLPNIKDAATIGVPDNDGMERVHVALVPRNQAEQPDFTKLTRLIVDELGALYAPASYSVEASLPRTPVGKTDKKALRAALLASGDATAEAAEGVCRRHGTHLG
ncbi:AMP-binding protein [Actinacidiphila guanduensis]|uniref:Fatty-acyl-CoA synthase n=1 Tax=Actinacidiphila guanduensis TaxID=310781 RepID=A0A1H0S2C9_9ACTN|nr:AMP-binding protein [Actinacidiphila guanduensis]SDP35775.1 fatty-acyl-CoA synthase [Actinacidiphila guanduensis]